MKWTRAETTNLTSQRKTRYLISSIGGLLKKMDRNLTRDEIECIFNSIDIDHSNSIEYDEFT